MILLNISAFLTYIILTSITPGPSNILVMNEANKHGFWGSWKFNGGIFFGFAFLGILSAIFTVGLYHSHSICRTLLKIAGASYMTYLAFHVLISGKGEKENPSKSSFLEGFIVQTLNVKSILFFLTVLSTFIIPTHSSYSYIMLCPFFIAILLGWSALLIWAGFGVILKKLFTKYNNLFKFLIALLLLYFL